MQILNSHPKTEPEALRVGHSHLCLISPHSTPQVILMQTEIGLLQFISNTVLTERKIDCTFQTVGSQTLDELIKQALKMKGDGSQRKASLASVGSLLQ